MITVFFHNMTMIITLMYVYTRFDNYILRKTQKFTCSAWVAALASLLSVLAMAHPFKLNDAIFDLRDVPILLVSYVFGWKIGIASIILPAIYRWYMAGPIAWQGILISLMIPALIGVLFKSRHQTIIPIKLPSLFVAFGVYSVIRFILMKLLIPMSNLDLIVINLNHIFFASISLTCMILMLNDAHKSRILKNKLEYMSKHDSLTDLLNLHHFKKEVMEIVEYSNPLAIAMLDIDYFKEYNDKHGHPEGDKVLEEFASLLKANTRQGDIIARYGGEEFILCLRNINHPEQVQISLERLRKVIEKDSKVTASIGFSFSSGNKSIDTLIQEADQALYDSKGKGRNQVSLYTNT